MFTDQQKKEYLFREKNKQREGKHFESALNLMKHVLVDCVFIYLKKLKYFNKMGFTRAS